MVDHYATLGVSPDASADEIKRVYRRLARELHPDANADDPEAEERFKTVTHAYEILSDPDKRRRYDTFGDDRAAGLGFGDFGGISDLFASFFGGVGGGRGPVRGADILAEIELTLEEAATGVARPVEVATLAECAGCTGSGAAPGTFPSRCSECGGTGEVRHVRRTMLGNMITATTCSRCRGRGDEITHPCPDCGGAGRVRSTHTLTIDIPAGIEDGARLRVGGRGEAGERGAAPGDLYVAIAVAPHAVFRRAGPDLGCEVEVPFTVAALGGTVEVPTLDGPEPLAIAPGTQGGEVVRLRARGMPRFGGRGRGELVVLLRVVTPADLDADQRDLLVKLAELRGEPVAPKTVLRKIKERSSRRSRR